MSNRVRVKDSEYYVEEAERCTRWSRMLNDKRSIAELEKMAEECLEKARHLRSIERATLQGKEPALV